MKYIIFIIAIILQIIFKPSFVFNLLTFLYGAYLLYSLLKNKILKKIFASSFILGVFIFFFSLGVILKDVYTNSNKIHQSNYVLILGGGISGDKPKPPLKARLDKGVDYFNIYPKTKFIVSGGLGWLEKYPESLIMKNYLIEQGVPAENIIEEDRSTSTLSNFVFSKELIPNENSFGVISNAFHMYRVKYIANRLNMNINPIYGKTPLINVFSSYTRESIALVFYYVRDFIFPNILFVFNK